MDTKVGMDSIEPIAASPGKSPEDSIPVIEIRGEGKPMSAAQIRSLEEETTGQPLDIQVIFILFFISFLFLFHFLFYCFFIIQIISFIFIFALNFFILIQISLLNFKPVKILVFLKIQIKCTWQKFIPN